MRAEPLSPPHALPVRKPQLISTSPHIDTLKPLEPYCSGGHTDTMHCTLSWSLIHASFSPRSVPIWTHFVSLSHFQPVHCRHAQTHFLSVLPSTPNPELWNCTASPPVTFNPPPAVLPLGLIQPHFSRGEGRSRCYACNVNVTVLWHHMYYCSSMWVCVCVWRYASVGGEDEVCVIWHWWKSHKFGFLDPTIRRSRLCSSTLLLFEPERGKWA